MLQISVARGTIFLLVVGLVAQVSESLPAEWRKGKTIRHIDIFET